MRAMILPLLRRRELLFHRQPGNYLPGLIEGVFAFLLRP